MGSTANPRAHGLAGEGSTRQLPPSLLSCGKEDPAWLGCPELQEQREMWIFR